MTQTNKEDLAKRCEEVGGPVQPSPWAKLLATKAIMSHEAWRVENDRLQKEILLGNELLKMPYGFYRIQEAFGCFIEIQPCCLLNEPPEGFVVRTSHYGSALKVLVPKNIQPGDQIRIVNKSRSGKSYIAEIVVTSI